MAQVMGCLIKVFIVPIDLFWSLAVCTGLVKKAAIFGEIHIARNSGLSLEAEDLGFITLRNIIQPATV